MMATPRGSLRIMDKERAKIRYHKVELSQENLVKSKDLKRAKWLFRGIRQRQGQKPLRREIRNKPVSMKSNNLIVTLFVFFFMYLE